MFGQCGGFNISANDSTACIPQVIRFKVTGNPPVGSTYRWDFGSGFNPGVDSNSFLFFVPGKYDVRLEMSFPNNTKCIITKKEFIEVGKTPFANITLDKVVLCEANDSVTITDLTPNSEIRDYIIEGIKYTNQPKVSVHQFSSTPGTRDITVIITDSFFKKKPCTIEHMSGDILKKIESDFTNDKNKAIEIINTALEEFENLRSARIIRCIIFMADKDIQQLYRYIDNASTYPRDICIWAEYINKSSFDDRKRVRNFNKKFDRNDLTLRD